MKLQPLPLAGAHIIKPEPFKDCRGMFARIYCEEELVAHGIQARVVQANHSINLRSGTIRGMHFQFPPKSEIKIVKCIRGAAFDVIVDIRRDSDTFLCWHGEIITCQNMYSIYIPQGFAHGFQTLEKCTELIYFSSEYYSPKHESGFNMTDPRVGIDWPLAMTVASERDRALPMIDPNFRGVQL